MLYRKPLSDIKLLNDQRFCEISPEVGENLRWEGLVIMFYHPCIMIGHCTRSTETSDKLSMKDSEPAVTLYLMWHVSRTSFSSHLLDLSAVHRLYYSVVSSNINVFC